MIHALRYTEELEKVGFSTEQAKKSVEVWMELMDQNFATKADFKEHYFMIKNDMLELRDEFNKRFVGVDKQFSEVDKRFTEIDKQFADVDRRFDKMDDRFDKLEDQLTIKLGIMMTASISLVAAIVSLIK